MKRPFFVGKFDSMNAHFAKTVLMVRPASFSFNEETQATNSFQNNLHSNAGIFQKAIEEFDVFVAKLRKEGIEVLVWDDKESPIKPDAIFPNNWFSTHPERLLVLYPMYAANRRLERDSDLIALLKSKYAIQKTLDLTSFEKEDVFLEGTGSLVFDHPNKMAYACHSPRTSEKLIKILCDEINYHYYVFDAFDRLGKPIYHTNVLMCFAPETVVVCLDALQSSEREKLENKLAIHHSNIIKISVQQMENFAGNMLCLQKEDGTSLLVLSKRAFDSLEPQQIKQLEKTGELLLADIPQIEITGGGGVRCMLAEIFWQDKSG
jgi:hypothetical protein